MNFSVHPEENIDKAFLAFCIEIVLLRMGKPQYEKVVSRLEKEYQTYIPECDKTPLALKRVLQDIFGDAYDDILKEIRSEIGEIVSKKYYTDFLTTMTK
ncbi:MAG: hypothetical protein FJ357_07220 [Thaumarchaeota archaeon]|nr:hypothetical protein [Nitrososphaerota archaeon]